MKKAVDKQDEVRANKSSSGQRISVRKKKTLLIVEDSELNRRILKRILLANGYNVIEAENGQVALDIILEPKNDISLIILDLTMPVMNGYELLERMQQNGLLKSIPVIVTTGSEKDNAEIRSLECGASDFISKPYNAEIICHRIESLLRLIDNAALIGKLEIDQLTGLYTREAFYRYAEMMLEDNPEQQYDIVCSNIENFKMINSKYGVTVGDELLKCIADHNEVCIGGNGVCGRIGADSFVVLRKSRPLRTQEEIEKTLLKTFKDAPVKNFRIQYGVYQITDRSVSLSVMCDCAQIALASIKHKYGMYYAVYDDKMKEKILREHQLTNFMEQALVERQFVVYLQPKHEVETGKIAGAEALVRWIHPELGFISPGEFIPLFERNGFITKLDSYVWETVCVILGRWAKEGKTLIPISVNASRADFSTNNMPEKVINMVDSYGIDHDKIHFEVTESAYTDNPQQIISAVSVLRSMGFMIEMDDFGSGYSSLNMLSELPIDILKLDMRFMQKGAGLRPDSKRSILSFIVSLSKWLQLPTVAEGVETEGEVELLKTMGCNYIQGFYFAKPMPVEEFEKYMDEKSLENCGAEKTTSRPAKTFSDDKLPVEQPLVLVAEDIESNRELIKEILGSYYTVVTASDGAEALDYIKKHAADISCILLDLLMPVMDGFQLLEKMRAEGYLEHIPVIITSEAGADSELRALQLGADSFVSKPYYPEILLHHVKKAVNEYNYFKFCENKNLKTDI